MMKRVLVGLLLGQLLATTAFGATAILAGSFNSFKFFGVLIACVALRFMQVFDNTLQIVDPIVLSFQYSVEHRQVLFTADHQFN